PQSNHQTARLLGLLVEGRCGGNNVFDESDHRPEGKPVVASSDFSVVRNFHDKYEPLVTQTAARLNVPPYRTSTEVGAIRNLLNAWIINAQTTHQVMVECIT